MSTTPIYINYNEINPKKCVDKITVIFTTDLLEGTYVNLYYGLTFLTKRPVRSRKAIFDKIELPKLICMHTHFKFHYNVVIPHYIKMKTTIILNYSESDFTEIQALKISNCINNNLYFDDDDLKLYNFCNNYRFSEYNYILKRIQSIAKIKLNHPKVCIKLKTCNHN